MPSFIPCSLFRGIGQIFRQWYGEVAQLRSLLPYCTPFAALTTTCTEVVQQKLITSLEQHNVDIIKMSPDRSNIRYSVVNASRDLLASFGWLINELKKQKERTPKTLVFCRSIDACSKLFRLFACELQEAAYTCLDSGKKGIQERLFAMYHAKIDKEDRPMILECFGRLGSCRVVFCTIAFGMGVDIPDIRRVIHYGPAADIDDYFQESGRAGRDGASSLSILYIYPGSLIGRVSAAMKQYCRSHECRRRDLLRYFSFGNFRPVDHTCCDVCRSQCACGGGQSDFLPSAAETPLSQKDEYSDDHEDEWTVREVSEEQRHQLRVNLKLYQQSLVTDAEDDDELVIPTCLEAIAGGLSDEMIDTIVEHCHLLASSDHLEELCSFSGDSESVFDINVHSLRTVYNFSCLCSSTQCGHCSVYSTRIRVKTL